MNRPYIAMLIPPIGEPIYARGTSWTDALERLTTAKWDNPTKDYVNALKREGIEYNPDLPIEDIP